MKTTTPTNQIHHEGEHAGVAPGWCQLDALENFNRDCLEGAGEIVQTTNGPRLVLRGNGGLQGDDQVFYVETDADYYGDGPAGHGPEHFNAQNGDHEPPPADLENGPSGLEVPEADAPAAPAGDDRYTAERLASYSVAALEEHLAARLDQRGRVRGEMNACHERLATLSDPDSPTYVDTIANLGSHTREHAIQNRIIRHLERALADRRRHELADQPARPDIARFELVDQLNGENGLPCGIEEAGDLKLARQLWERAYQTLEASGAGSIAPSGMPTNGDVARVVADTYGTLYCYGTTETPAARAARIAAREGANADADRMTEWRGVPVGREITLALAVMITDPRIRLALDPKALEQARTALGFTD